MLLEDFGDDRDSRVDRVGDDAHKCLGCELGSSSSKITDNAGVDFEEVVAGHTRLSWHTSRDDN